jgi:hypothetical protein
MALSPGPSTRYGGVHEQARDRDRAGPARAAPTAAIRRIPCWALAAPERSLAKSDPLRPLIAVPTPELATATPLRAHRRLPALRRTCTGSGATTHRSRPGSPPAERPPPRRQGRHPRAPGGAPRALRERQAGRPRPAPGPGPRPRPPRGPGRRTCEGRAPGWLSGPHAHVGEQWHCAPLATANRWVWLRKGSATPPRSGERAHHGSEFTRQQLAFRRNAPAGLAPYQEPAGLQESGRPQAVPPLRHS